MSEKFEIGQARVFNGFGDDDVVAFTAAATAHQVVTGHVFFNSGASNASLFVIASGKVRVTRSSGEQRIDLATLGNGETFGEMSFLDSSPTTATVTAIESAEVLEIDRAGLEKLMVQRPAVVAQLWQNLAVELKGRLTRTNELIDHYVELNRQLMQTQRT